MHRLHALRGHRRAVEVERDLRVAVLERNRVRRSSVHREIGCLNRAGIHRVAQIDDKIRRLGVMRLLQAGSLVVTAKPTSSLSVKASCWDCAADALRPSIHEDTCLVSNAEP